MPDDIAISEHDAAFIRALLDAGTYPDASAVVQAGLRLLQQQQDGHAGALQTARRLIAAGEDEEQHCLPIDTVFEQLDAKLNNLPRLDARRPR